MVHPPKLRIMNEMQHCRQTTKPIKDKIPTKVVTEIPKLSRRENFQAISPAKAMKRQIPILRYLVHQQSCLLIRRQTQFLVSRSKQGLRFFIILNFVKNGRPYTLNFDNVLRFHRKFCTVVVSRENFAELSTIAEI